MQILIVDDVKETCDYIARVITRNYKNIICDCAYSYSEAMTLISSSVYDMFILDYELEQNNAMHNGIALGKAISMMSQYANVPVMFETSYPEQVFNAVNSLNCMYYLVKPFDDRNIMEMMDKVLSTAPAGMEITFHNASGVKTLIDLRDIIYAKSMRHIILIVTHYQEYKFTNYSLSSLETESENYLVRCHKSYLINPRYIKHIDKLNHFVTLAWHRDTATIPIGRAYNDAVYNK